MTQTHHTNGSIKLLLQKAIASNAKREVVERLQWFAHYAEHQSISKTCREFGIARTTFYRWFHRLNDHDLSTLENSPKSQLLQRTPVGHNCIFCRFAQRVHNWVRRPSFYIVVAAALINLSLLLLLTPQTASATAVVINTEAFEKIDDLDPDADLVLKFGDTLNKSLSYKRVEGTFSLDDDLEVQGFFSATGIDGAGLSDCDDTANSKLLWDASTKTFSCGTDQNSGGPGTTTLQEAYDNDSDVGDAMITLNNDDDSIIIRNPASNGTDSENIFHVEQLASGTAAFIKSDSGVNPALVIDASLDGDSGALAPHIKFGYNDVFDTDLFRDSAGTLRTSDAFVADTLQAKTSLQSLGNLTVDGSTITFSSFDCSGNANGGALTVNASGQLECTDDDSGGGGADLSPYMVIDTTGNQVINATEATVNLDSEEITNANYSLANDEITIATAGTYQVSYTLNYDITNTSGGNRGRTTCHLQDDDSGSYAASPGSYASVYHREAAGGSGLSTTFLLVVENDNTKIRLRVDRTYGSTNIDTIANQTSLSITKIE